jgi:hypothetical protein
MIERVKKVGKIARVPMKTNAETRRVEIIVLKFHEEKSVIDECVSRIIHNTEWPFKLTVYDNRMNTPNTSRIWNHIIAESACEYICIIDSDAFVPQTNPCWLTRMMESIDDKGVVVAMGDTVGGANKATEPAPYPSQRPQEGIWSGFCALYRKPTIVELGGFDEAFNLYGQDSEFAYRCLKKLGGATYRTDVFVHHEGSHSAKKANDAGTLDREAEKLYAQTLYRNKTR